VAGATIHLARELARCWGNLQYGIVEMLRDDFHGQSEMLAFAWDVQTNTRNSSTFIVPHKRDTKKGVTTLTDMRDIYENNTNNASRRVREAIFAVLPPWFVEQAKSLCSKTLEHGGGIPLATRISNAISRFADLDITQSQLEDKVGRPAGRWNARDAAQLAVTFTSIQRGEVRVEEAFPPPRVTTEEITGRPAPPPSVPETEIEAATRAAAEASWASAPDGTDG
jgi:hypothetical protein